MNQPGRLGVWPSVFFGVGRVAVSILIAWKVWVGMRTVFDRNLSGIRDNILRMSSLVEQAIDRTFAAMRSQDDRLAQLVVAGDQVIDDLGMQIENAITATVARHQPIARDLRTLLADLLITNELEWMGDHAEEIAQNILNRLGVAPDDLPFQLGGMHRTVQAMLRESMDAYVSQDAELAKSVALNDDEVDRLYQGLFSGVIEAMVQGDLPVERGTFLLWAGHNLEQLADRVTNICERIVYTGTGGYDHLNLKPGEDVAVSSRH
jgi:phosphate transport system protein